MLDWHLQSSSGDDFFHHMTGHVREAEISAIVIVSESLVVKAE